MNRKIKSFTIMKYPKLLWYKDWIVYINFMSTNNGSQLLYFQDQGKKGGSRWSKPEQIVREKLFKAMETISKRAEHIRENGTEEEKKVVEELFKDLIPKVL